MRGMWTLALLLAAAPLLHAASYMVTTGNVTINALAVSPTGGGSVLPILVTLVSPGDGRAYVAGIPEAGEGFGPSAQVALYVAARLAGVPYSNYTALLRVLAPPTEAQVGGPSASGYLTVAMYALMKGLRLRNDTAMTGIILPDGLIGPVGGVSDKVAAAARSGMRMVLVPLGERPPLTSGAQVVEVGTVEDAIYLLTGVRPPQPPRAPPSNSTFLEVSRILYRAIYGLYNSTTGPMGDRYIDRETVADLAGRGMYYAAASLVYQGLAQHYIDQASTASARRRMSSQALQMAREAEAQARAIPVTVNNLDLMVGLYLRIYQVYNILNASSAARDVGLAYARALTLQHWLSAARQLAYGPAVDERSVADIAAAYLEYARAMYAYLTTVASSSNLGQMEAELRVAEQLYSRGHYLASLAASVDIISTAAAALIATPDPYIAVARQRALSDMARAAACGSPNILAFSYLQFGDYHRGAGATGDALSEYIMASMYATATSDAICRSNGTYTVPMPSFTWEEPPRTTAEPPAAAGEARENAMFIPILVAALAVLALIYAARR